MVDTNKERAEFALQLARSVEASRRWMGGSASRDATLQSKFGLGSKKSLRPTLSRWHRGSLGGFGLPKGAHRIAALASIQAMESRRAAGGLVQAFIALASRDRSQITADRIGSLKEFLDRPDGPFPAGADAEDWILFAIYVGLAVLVGDPEGPFMEGWTAWEQAREGYDVPPEAFYTVRRSLFSAKRRLVAEHGLDRCLGRIGRLVPLEGPPPEFGAYDPVPVDLEAASPEGFGPLPAGTVKREKLYHSPAIDKLLVAGGADGITLEVEASRYEPPGVCNTFCWLALCRVLGGDSDVFNGVKVRAPTELTERTFDDGRLRVERTSYLASQVTNWSTHVGFRHRNRESDRPLKLADIAGRPLGRSDLSSHFGVMTLVLTSDSFLVAMYQGEENDRSGGELVPFGGSVEFFDLDKLLRCTLGSLLKFSARREVCEEAVIDREDVEDTLILGHALDAKKNLKPDFFAVTFVRRSFLEIESNQEEVYGGPLLGEQIDLSTGESLCRSLEDVERKWGSLQSAAFLHANLSLARQSAEAIVARFQQLRPGKAT